LLLLSNINREFFIKKYSFLIILSVFFINNLFCDASADIKKAAIENIPAIKFRGTVSFVWDYLFEIQDGVNPGSHFSPITYQGLDCTDNGDPEKTFHNTNGRIIGGTWGGTQFEAYIDYHFIFSFLKFNNPLTKNNNIKFSLHGQLSPITINGGFSLTLTPVSFLTFQAGFLIGAGWNIPNFAAGLGINNKGIIIRDNVFGPQVQTWFSSTFQFDLSVVLPKRYQRWTHIVMLLTPMIKYQALLTIPENQPYMYQECPGEKMNGWKFLGEFLLAYRFFIIEDDTGENNRFIKSRNNNFIFTLGMFVWIDYLNLTHYFDSPMKNGWGSDFAYVNFGPAAQFDLPNNFFIKIFFFFQNDKAYTSETAGNSDFRDRKYSDWYVYFRWFGLFFGWNF
jgi:hypothetical protein